MANTKSAAKRARQTIKRAARNRSVLSALKTETKRTQAQFASGSGDKEATRKSYAALVSDLDKAAKRGVIHQNVADRRKSRLAKKLAALGA
jgi:small subunit ribosomal protein S20